MVLSAIGEAPVSTLANPFHEVSLAQTQILNSSRELQMAGLHCNTDHDYILTPEEDEIEVPATALSVRPYYPSDFFVVRAGKLYNKTTNSFTFTDPVHCNIIWYLDFFDLPEPHRFYIAVRAARVVAHNHVGAMDIERFTAADEARAKVLVDAEEMRASGHRMCDYAPVNRILASHRRR